MRQARQRRGKENEDTRKNRVRCIRQELHKRNIVIDLEETLILTSRGISINIKKINNK